MMVGRRLRPERHHGPTRPAGVSLHPSGLKLRTSHVLLLFLRTVRSFVTAHVVSVGEARVAKVARIRFLRLVYVLVFLETLSDQI